MSQQPTPTPVPNAVVGCLVIIGLCCVIGGACYVTMPSDEELAAIQAAQELHGSVRTDATSVFIFNESDVDWTACVVSLNAGMLDNGFTRGVQTIRAHQHAQLALTDFSDSTGLRFNPRTHRVNSISVAATTPDGIAAMAFSAAS